MERTLLQKEYKKILQSLYEIRTRKGLRQVDLAKQLGVQQSFVSKYESGERRLDVLELRAICKCLDVDMNEILKSIEQ